MKELIINIEGESYKYDVPTGWQDVQVDAYQRVMAIDRTSKTDLELLVEIFVALTGADPEYVWMMDSDQFDQIVELLAFTEQDIKAKPVDSLILEGEEYFVKKDFEQFTVGETISIEAILKEVEGDVFKAIDRLLCIFLRKKLPSGELETFRSSFMNRAELFKTVKIQDIHNLFIFFLTGKNLS